ncbi:MAG: hypothetical protein HQM11_19975 [SAR324 cluster bacterium]|nr:hypothetical protein [SAR324 cluster bacterium]
MNGISYFKASPLLMTKLRAPSVSEQALVRSRLITALNDGLNRRLTVVSAPAGFGKTTLLSQWTSALSCPSVWIALDEEDNSPLRLLHYLLTGIKAIVPEIENSLEKISHSARIPPIKTTMSWLMNELERVAQPIVLVLDDYQMIQSREIHQAVQYSLQNLPANVRLVLSTRNRLPFAIAKFRARQQLIELEEQDLRFTLEEMSEFLIHKLETGLSAKELDLLYDRTEGWIAAIQMAVLSSAGSHDLSSAIREFSGKHKYIADYLMEELFRDQSWEVRDFLRMTSILRSMTAELCNAVTGREDSHDILGYLEKSNLFLIGLDSHRKWFRYHNLFTQFLQNHLTEESPLLIRQLHLTASRWYLSSGMDDEALHHLIVIEDYEKAADVLEGMVENLLRQSEIFMVLERLRTIPDEVIHSRIWLCFARGIALCLIAQLKPAREYLLLIESLWNSMSPAQRQEEAYSSMSGYLDVMRSYLELCLGSPEQGILYAENSLARLKQDDSVMRNIALICLGHANLLAGNTRQALAALSNAHQMSSQTSNMYTMMIASYLLIHFWIQAGYLREAVALAEKQRLDVENNHWTEFPATGFLYIAFAELEYELNALSNAEHYFTRGLKLAENGNIKDLTFYGSWGMARLQYAQGKTAEAFQWLNRAIDLKEWYQVPFYAEQIDSCAAQFRITQGQLEQTGQWSERYRFNSMGTEYLHEKNLLVRVRYHLAVRDPDSAMTLITTLETSIRRNHRQGRLIELLALKSLTLYHMKKNTEAFSVLDEALSLAESQRYIRTFLDTMPTISNLLSQFMKHRKNNPLIYQYACQLLNACDQNQPVCEPKGVNKLLSQREYEILRLMADGEDNKSIAARLFVELSTIKTHIKHIFNKLNVHSRTQALAKAREMDLF